MTVLTILVCLVKNSNFIILVCRKNPYLVAIFPFSFMFILSFASKCDECKCNGIELDCFYQDDSNIKPVSTTQVMWKNVILFDFMTFDVDI